MELELQEYNTVMRDNMGRPCVKCITCNAAIRSLNHTCSAKFFRQKYGIGTNSSYSMIWDTFKRHVFHTNIYAYEELVKFNHKLNEKQITMSTQRLDLYETYNCGYAVWYSSDCDDEFSCCSYHYEY